MLNQQDDGANLDQENTAIQNDKTSEYEYVQLLIDEKNAKRRLFSVNSQKSKEYLIEYRKSEKLYDQNSLQAIEVFEKLAEKGFPHACRKLAFIYSYLDEGNVALDYAKAVDYFNRTVTIVEEMSAKLGYRGEDWLYPFELSFFWNAFGIAAIYASISTQDCQLQKICNQHIEKFIECKYSIFDGILKFQAPVWNMFSDTSKLLATIVRDEESFAGKLVRGKSPKLTSQFYNAAGSVIDYSFSFFCLRTNFGDNSLLDALTQKLNEILDRRDRLRKFLLLKEIVRNYHLFPYDLLQIIIMPTLLPEKKVINNLSQQQIMKI